jgi:hypothetical protein
MLPHHNPTDPFRFGALLRGLAKHKEVPLRSVAAGIRCAYTTLHSWVRGTRPVEQADVDRLIAYFGLVGLDAVAFSEAGAALRQATKTAKGTDADYAQVVRQRDAYEKALAALLGRAETARVYLEQPRSTSAESQRAFAQELGQLLDGTRKRLSAIKRLRG